MCELRPLLREMKVNREMSGDRNSGCRTSAVLSGGSGGRGSSGRGSGGRSIKGQNCNKRAGWEDVGNEFYREAYPMSIDNLYDTRITTLLPSSRHVSTLGRGTIRRRASTRSRHLPSISQQATLVHTTGRRGSDTYLEVLPDLTQGVDEEETWEKLQEIRMFAVPMEEKRMLKRQLQAAPTLRTRGLAAFKLSRRKFSTQLKVRLREMISKIELWHWSLRYVEGNFGPGLVAFFTFIKWLLYLNLFTCAVIAVFILVPQFVFQPPQNTCIDSNYIDENSTLNYDDIVLSTENYDESTISLYENISLSDSNTTSCCFQKYKEVVEKAEENQETSNRIFNLVLDGLQGTGVVFELSYLFYGFYPRSILHLEVLGQWEYNLPLAYLLVVVVTLVLSLLLMVKAAARGLRESLRSSEGQFYQYCNLVFGGWDFCIENQKAAAIKKKAIYNELCNHLETERYKEEKSMRTKRERCRLYFVRLLVNMGVIVILVLSFVAIYYATNYSLKVLEENTLESIKDPSKKWSSRVGGKLNPEKVYGVTISDGSEDGAEAENEEIEGFWRKIQQLQIEFLPSLVIVALNFIDPFIFKLLVEFEVYTPNTVLLVTLIRTVFLRLTSLIVLLVSIYKGVNKCGTPQPGECLHNSCIPCWETYVGQQLYKLAILDLLIMFLVTFFLNAPRKCIGHRIMRGSRLGALIGDIEFDVPKHVLDIVYGQTLCWLGMFYSPCLPAVTCVKLVLVFYIKYFDCTMNSSQSSQLYRTSRSNALFITILLISFIVTIIPVGYSIAEIKPSVTCGPFRGLETIWTEIVDLISGSPWWVQSVLFFMGTAGFAVPAIIILILLSYYYYAVAAANKHMVALLKNQLVLEGHDKQFLLNRLDQIIKKNAQDDHARSNRSSMEDETGHSNDQTLEA